MSTFAWKAGAKVEQVKFSICRWLATPLPRALVLGDLWACTLFSDSEQRLA